MYKHSDACLLYSAAHPLTI